MTVPSAYSPSGRRGGPKFFFKGSLALLLLGSLILAGCGRMGIGSDKVSARADAGEKGGKGSKSKTKKHAGIFGLRSMDLYTQGETVDVLLADGEMGSEFPA